jgi:two-component system chemotaxis response regulator CheB
VALDRRDVDRAAVGRPYILNRAGPLRVPHAIHGEPIEHGRIYVAPPNHQLLVDRGVVHVTHGPRENGHRPAVDPLFRSAAEAYERQVIGVVLSEALDDGTAGLAAIKRLGGMAVVQSVADAAVTSMPRSALENVEVDHCVPAARMGELLSTLVTETVPRRNGLYATARENRMRQGETIGPDAKPVGEASGFTCPECGGSLWEGQEGDIVRYRCHVGHGFSGDSLLSEQSAVLEAALWTAYRALEQRAALARRLATQARRRGHAITAGRFQEQTEDARRRAAVVSEALGSTDLDQSLGHSEEARAPDACITGS